MGGTPGLDGRGGRRGTGWPDPGCSPGRRPSGTAGAAKRLSRNCPIKGVGQPTEGAHPVPTTLPKQGFSEIIWLQAETARIRHNEFSGQPLRRHRVCPSWNDAREGSLATAMKRRKTHLDDKIKTYASSASFAARIFGGN